MRTLQRAGAGLLALTLAAGIAACGSDSDKEASSDTTAAQGENASFCDALVKFNAAVFQVDISEDTPKDDIISEGKKIAPLFADVAENAPDELSASAGELNTTIQALTKGDAEAFNSDATFSKYTSLVDGGIDACEMETTDITGVDYAYEGVPKTMKAGTTAFKFTNASKGGEFHMMAVVKKKAGVDLSWDEILALPDNEGEDKTEFKGETEAEPGKSSKALVNLDPGSYAMICFISVGGKDDGPPHFTQGMVQEFTVE